MADVKRTLISEYILDGDRRPAGSVVTLNATAFKKAVKAGVVHEDDELDAEVPKLPDAADQAGTAAAGAGSQNVDTLLNTGKQQQESPTPAPGKVKT